MHNRQQRSLGAVRYAARRTLSGGERQMLALAEVLIRRPQMSLVEEPSIGLAPTILEGLQAMIADISLGGITVLVAEQNVGWIAAQATRVCLLESGQFVAQGRPDETNRREQRIESFLGKDLRSSTARSSASIRPRWPTR